MVRKMKKKLIDMIYLIRDFAIDIIGFLIILLLLTLIRVYYIYERDRKWKSRN